MSRKHFILPLAIVLLAFPVLASDAPTAQAEASEKAVEQDAPDKTAPASCESASEATQDAAALPFGAQPFQELQPAAGGSCGGAVCGKFEWCCNPSCSRCVLIGMQCTQESCN